MNRRGFLTLGATFLAAPAILRVTTLDVLPQYETVAEYVWRLEARGDSRLGSWKITGTTIATDYAIALKELGRGLAALREPGDPSGYFSLGRRDDSLRLVTRRRERILV